MAVTHICFSASFFIFATSSALLLTWTCWWMAVVGPSMPARRPFYKPMSEVPALIQSASTFASAPIFAYSLAGGWPSFNSAMRLAASLLAVLSAFSFALIAAVARDAVARRLLSAVLALVAALALAAGALDVVAIARTASECARNECTSEVPDIVRNSGNTCRCAVDGWFYFTVFVDVILLVTALVCLVITFRPLMRRPSSPRQRADVAE